MGTLTDAIREAIIGARSRGWTVEDLVLQMHPETEMDLRKERCLLSVPVTHFEDVPIIVSPRYYGWRLRVMVRP